jgi:D-alanine-D-alanine ligase
MSNGIKRVGVFFGGRSPEHDISVVTGLQVTAALDPSLFETIPVYISTNGRWYTGDALLDRNSYLPKGSTLEKLTHVTLSLGTGGQATLLPVDPKNKKAKPIPLDFAIPAFHGVQGEDGCIQGAFEMAGLPYSGMRVLAAAAFMDKLTTKELLRDEGIPLLPTININRPERGLLVLPEELQKIVGDLVFPCILKPRNLGSSIGVAKCDTMQELADSLPEVFRFDKAAIVEPFVPNLVEYNVSVARIGGETRTSAIERPKHSSELLDFKTKYLSSGGGTKGGTKQLGRPSEGMLSLTRDINPELPGGMSENIRTWARKTFDHLGASGAPRIDFLSNSKTGEVWLNEVNPLPGSFAYFLWEAATPSVAFTDLMEHFIREGEELHRRSRLPDDPTPTNARLFTR